MCFSYFAYYFNAGYLSGGIVDILFSILDLPRLFDCRYMSTLADQINIVNNKSANGNGKVCRRLGLDKHGV